MAIIIAAAGSPVTAPAYAATSDICTEFTGNNYGTNNYTRAASPVYSYLTEEGDGYMRVQGYKDDSEDTGIDVIFYDRDLNATAYRHVSRELPLFGAFAQTADNYFIISGQENADELDDCEVLRVTKYDKSWNRIDSCSLYGINTSLPFRSGSCRTAVVGDHIAIHTSHRMFKSSDGLNHQSNMTFEIDTSAMEFTYTRYIGYSYQFPEYTSHSFNQFIVAGDGEAAVLDHGDAYPRSIKMSLFSGDPESGQILSRVYETDKLADIPGEIGDNNTGVSLGGFEKTSTGYIAAGNSIYQHDNETMDLSRPRNVFVTAVDTSGEETTAQTNWLTDVSYDTGTPQLAKVSNDCFVVLWSHGAEINYVAVDAGGKQISELYTGEGELSDCKPVVSDGKIMWYVYDGNEAVFYTITAEANGSGQAVLGQPVVIQSDTGHDFATMSAENGVAALRCTRCGAEKTVKYPGYLRMGYMLANGTGYIGAGEICVDINDRVWLFGATYDENDNLVPFKDITLESDDPECCIVNNKDASVRFKGTGRHLVKARCKYDPSITGSIYIMITKQLESVKLTAQPESPQEFGKEVRLIAREDGGRGNEVFTFTVRDQDGNETVLEKTGADRIRTWTPDKPGTYTIEVSVYDEDEPYIVVSDSLVYEVTKAEHPAVMPSEKYSYPFAASVVIGNELLEAAADAGWEFEAEDIGTVIEPGEEKTFTVHYNNEDRDFYNTTEMAVSIAHSNCDHSRTEVRGARESTCSVEGATGDEYCLECGELVKASMPVPVDPDAHTGLRTIPAKKARVMEDGNTEGQVCDDCGMVIEEPQTVPGITEFDIELPDKEDAVYDGAPFYAYVWAYAGDTELTEGKDYVVTHSNNINAGTARVKVTLIGQYEGEKEESFVIAKAVNTLAVRGRTAQVKYSALKKKNQYLALSKVITLTRKGQGTRTYVKATGNRKILINKTTGKVTIKRGLKKGTYKVKVKVTASGSRNYKARTRTTTFTIKVR